MTIRMQIDGAAKAIPSRERGMFFRGIIEMVSSNRNALTRGKIPVQVLPRLYLASYSKRINFD